MFRHAFENSAFESSTFVVAVWMLEFFDPFRRIGDVEYFLCLFLIITFQNIDLLLNSLFSFIITPNNGHSWNHNTTNNLLHIFDLASCFIF